MEQMYYAYSRFVNRSNQAALPAMTINQKVRRMEEGKAYGTQLAQYSPYQNEGGFTGIGNSGTGSRGHGSSADGAGDFLTLILLSFAGIDRDE